MRIVVVAAVAGRPIAAADGHGRGQPTSNLHADLQPIVVGPTVAVDLGDVDPWSPVDDFCHQKWQIVVQKVVVDEVGMFEEEVEDGDWLQPTIATNPGLEEENWVAEMQIGGHDEAEMDAQMEVDSTGMRRLALKIEELFYMALTFIF